MLTANNRILQAISQIFKTEDRSITALVVLVFLLAAAHNYDALRHFAAASGVAPWLSYATPILIDTFIAAAVWVSLRNKRYGEPARLAWSIVLLFTVASITLNLMHYPLIPGGVAVAVLVPVVVFLSAELAKGLVESQRNRSGAAAATAALQAQQAQLAADVERKSATVAQLETQLAQLQTQLEAQKAQQKTQLKADFAQQKAQLQAQLEAQKAQLEAQLEKAQNGQIDPIWRESYQIDGLLAAGLTQRQAAELLQISESTVRNRLKNLNGDSLLHRLERV